MDWRVDLDAIVASHLSRRVSTLAIARGAGSVIAVMTWLGVIDTAIATLTPVGSMLLSGSRAIYAAIYQFVVLATIFAASGFTSLVSTLLMRTHAFTDAEQLMLRPGTARVGAASRHRRQECRHFAARKSECGALWRLPMRLAIA